MHMGGTKVAPQAQKQVLFQHLIGLLDHTGYWRVDAKKPLMQQNLANFFFRMDMTEQEIQTLFGLFDSLHKSRNTL
jgi:tRNA/rRNA methyltransferase